MQPNNNAKEKKGAVMGREEFEVFQVRKKERQEKGEQRRQAADNSYEKCAAYAQAHGLVLKRYTALHWSVAVPYKQFHLDKSDDEKVRWLYNLYPGNQRIYCDPARRGRFVPVTRPWTVMQFMETLVGVVQREARALAKMQHKFGANPDYGKGKVHHPKSARSKKHQS